MARTSKNPAILKLAYSVGWNEAIKEAGLENFATELLGRSAKYIAPSALGAILGGEEHRTEGALAGLGLGLLGAKGGGIVSKHMLTPEQWAVVHKLEKNLPRLEEIDKVVADKLKAYQAQRPMVEWISRLGGGAAGGLMANKLLGRSTPPGINAMLPVTDMTTHYTGLTPEDLMSLAAQTPEESNSPIEEIGAYP